MNKKLNQLNEALSEEEEFQQVEAKASMTSAGVLDVVIHNGKYSNTAFDAFQIIGEVKDAGWSNTEVSQLSTNLEKLVKEYETKIQGRVDSITESFNNQVQRELSELVTEIESKVEDLTTA